VPGFVALFACAVGFGAATTLTAVATSRRPTRYRFIRFLDDVYRLRTAYS
jgi:hypothetical protein